MRRGLRQPSGRSFGRRKTVDRINAWHVPLQHRTRARDRCERLRGDGDLDLDARLERDARLKPSQPHTTWKNEKWQRTICLTISDEEWRSMRRLCTLSS